MLRRILIIYHLTSLLRSSIGHGSLTQSQAIVQKNCTFSLILMGHVSKFSDRRKFRESAQLRFHCKFIMKWHCFCWTTFGCSSEVCFTRNIPLLIFFINGGQSLRVYCLNGKMTRRIVHIFHKKIIYESGNSTYKLDQLFPACYPIELRYLKQSNHLAAASICWSLMDLFL